MLATWSDGNETVFETLNILKSVNWTIYSLHNYVIRVVSASPKVQAVDPKAARSRSRTAMQVLDILMELIGGIRMFMKRDDKCKRFVIKKHRDIADKLEHLQNDLTAYCAKHRPSMKLECKVRGGRSYRYRHYTQYNDDTVDLESKQNDDIPQDDDNNGDDNGDGDGDQIYMAMKDIWNSISSVLRHVKRYQMHVAEQRKMHEVWKRTTKKGRLYAKQEELRRQQREAQKSSGGCDSANSPITTATNALTASSISPAPGRPLSAPMNASNASPPPPHQYQMVLHRDSAAKRAHKKQSSPHHRKSKSQRKRRHKK